MNHRLFGALALMACVSTLSACDLPTLPSWDLTLRIPGEEGTIDVGGFLPEGVEVVDGRFAFPTWAESGAVTVSDVCVHCSTLDGLQTFYPAFTHDVSSGLVLGGGFDSAVLFSGEIDLIMTHSLPFPILRNEDGQVGSITLRLRGSDGSVIALDSVHGADEPFPAGPTDPLVLTLDLNGVTVGPDLALELSIRSPGSGPSGTYPMDSDAAISWAIQVDGLTTPAVVVHREATAFTGDPSAILIDEAMRERLLGPIARASLIVEVTQPFDLPGALSFAFHGSAHDALTGSDPVAEQRVDLVRGTTIARIVLGEDEMRALLDPDTESDGIHIVYSGGFDATGPSGLTVRAADTIRYITHLDVDLTVNGGDGS